MSYNPRVLRKDGVGFPSEVLVLSAVVGRFVSINDERVQILELTLAVHLLFKVKKIKVLGQFELYILIISYETFMRINRKVATLFLTSSRMPNMPFQLPGSYHQPIISQSRSMDFSKIVKSVWARQCCHDK